jgi:TP901 family phage tail tape measure protein
VADVAKGIIDIEINTGNAAAQLKALQQQINAFTLSVNKNNSFQSNAAAKYTSELKDLINASRFFTAETVKMRTSAGALDATLRKGQGTLGQFFNAKFNRNSALFAETMGLASERARTMQTQFIATTGASRGMQEALAIRPLAAFNSQLTIASQRSQILTSMFKQGTTQLINFGKNVQWAGRQLMVGFTLPLTVFGTTAGKTFMELEKQAVAFKKVYGDIFTTPAELQGNLESVMALGREYTKYGIAVKDTVGLAAQAAAAGRRNKDLTDAVTQATRLATLGQMSQNEALDTTIALQSAFRLSGQELADTVNFLNMVENQTVVSLQDLAAAIPRVAPVIQGLGGDVKDMSVFLAAMQEGGVSAEQGANALKSGLGSLINPTKAATQMLAGFNINLDAIIQANRGDLMGTVMEFGKALQTLDEFSRQQVLEQVFGKFQYARLGALFENIVRDGSQANQVLQTMGFSSEQLRQTAEKELGVIENSFGVQLIAAIEKFKLAIAPIGQLFVELAIPVVNFITSIVDKFNSLPDFTKKFIAFATIITGLVIPAGTMFFGLLMNLSGTLAKLLQSIGIFSKGLMKGGLLGGVQALTQSMKYLSLEEIDAAIAAKQLGNATMSSNDAFRQQVAAAEGARVAVKNLGDTYQYLIARMAEAAGLSKVTFATPGTALKTAQARSKNIKGAFPRRFATGGPVPGSGNQDTVPAMLTPGEFVVTKDATKSIGTKFLERLNMGGVAGYKNGTKKIENQINLEAMKNEAGATTSTQSERQSTLGASQRAHNIAGQTAVAGPGGVSTSRGVIPEGYTYQKLADRIIDIDATLNNNLKDKGVTGRQLLNDFKARKMSVFQTMDNQFVNFFEDEKIRLQTTTNLNSGQIAKKLRQIEANYTKTKKQIYRRYIKTFSRYPDRVFTDTDLGKVSNQVYRVFDKNSTLKNFHNELKQFRSTRIRKTELKETARSAGLSTKGTIPELLNRIEDDRVAKGLAPMDSKLKSNIINRGTNEPAKGSKESRLFYGDKNKGGRFNRREYVKTIAKVLGKKFAKGGSVPSLLTPGEFVVNKDAAAANRPFLDALNAGQVKKFQFGTPAAEYDTEAGPMTRSQSRKMGIRSVGNRVRGGASAASFGGFLVGGALQTSSNEAARSIGGVVIAASMAQQAFSLLGPVVKKLAIRLPMLTNPVGLAITGFMATAGILTYVFNKQLAKLTDASAAMTRAMYGGSESLENFAQAYGRKTFRQQAIESATSAVGGQTSQESQQFSSQFMQQDQGQQLLESIRKIRKEGGDAVQALRNQLSQAVVSGLITTEEAKTIAKDVGVALNDQNLAVNAVGQIVELLGPNGEKLDNNTMQIIAEISPKFNFAEMRAQAEKAYQEDTGFFAKLFGRKEDQTQAVLTADVVQGLAITTENFANATAKARDQYINGQIDLKKYNEEIAAYAVAVGTESTKATQIFARNIGISVNDIEKFAKEVEVKGSYGDKVWTEPTKRAKQIQAFFKEQRNGIDTMLEGLGDKTSNELINGILKFSGGEGPKSAEIFNQMLTGTLSQDLLNQIVTFLNSQGLTDAANQFKSKFAISTRPAGFIGPVAPNSVTPGEEQPPEPAQKSKIQLLQESITQTKEYTKAIDTLMKKGLTAEAAANLDAATAIEIVKTGRYKLIKSINDQVTAQAVLQNVLKSKDERRQDILDAENDAIDNNISLIQDQINAVNRLNELDQRQVSLRQKGLDELSKKETAVNKVYNDRVSALTRVKEANAQVTQQQQDRVNLASALTGGDIAAAAQAAATMTENFASGQIDQAQAELDLQRQREVEALTVSVNGQLLTRQQIESQIDVFNERIYQRNLATLPLQDQIFGQEQRKLAIQREIDNIQLNIRQKQIQEEQRAGRLVGYYKSMAWWTNQRAKGTFEGEPQATGGVIQKKAFGGFLKYTSNEPAPGMAMGGKMKKYAVGNIVPGLGNTDRVPALLTPGEFVVRKSVASENMDMLKALNGDVFPSIKGGNPSVELGSVPTTQATINNTPVYTYNVNVNVPNTDASPEQIANVVVAKLRRTSDANLRSSRF